MRKIVFSSLLLSMPLVSFAQTYNAAGRSAANSVAMPAVVSVPVTEAVLPSASLTPLGLVPTLSAPHLDVPSLSLPSLQPSSLASSPALTPLLSAAVHPALVVASKPSLSVAPVKPLTPALSVLSAASVAADSPDAKAQALSPSLDALFDGSTTRDASIDAVPVAARVRPSLLKRAALAASGVVAFPSVALAQAASHPSVASSLPLLENWQPAAVAVAAILGVLFGLWATRSKDGSPPSAGQVFSTALSYGAIAGGAVYALVDLTQIVFAGGAAVGLVPLTAAVAIAALAQNAFAAKFSDASATPADRIMGAFPAVAACFGLTVTVATLVAPPLMLTLGTALLGITGAATALYVALFRLDKSPASGPSLLGRGFVLQVLMTGLALALSSQIYSWFFFALGLWGFGSVMLATGREVLAAVKGYKAPPAPPKA